jgi:hypothetical protein
LRSFDTTGGGGLIEHQLDLFFFCSDLNQDPQLSREVSWVTVPEITDGQAFRAFLSQPHQPVHARRSDQYATNIGWRACPKKGIKRIPKIEGNPRLHTDFHASTEGSVFVKISMN